MLGDIAEQKKRIQDMHRYLEASIQQARTEAISWERIAGALGITKQAAWEQYRHLDKFNH